MHFVHLNKVQVETIPLRLTSKRFLAQVRCMQCYDLPGSLLQLQGEAAYLLDSGCQTASRHVELLQGHRQNVQFYLRKPSTLTTAAWGPIYNRGQTHIRTPLPVT